MDSVVCEVGSGPDARRVKFSRLLADPSVTTIVVEHRDRAARFGLELLQAMLGAQGASIAILEDGEVANARMWAPTQILHVVLRPAVWAGLGQAAS